MKQDIFSLDGKTVVLTGAAGFFGTYFAEALLAQGASKVFLLDRNEEKLKALGDALREKFMGQDVVTRQIDQNDHAAAGKSYESIIADGPVDVLINNAFDFGKRTGFNDQSGRLECATFEQLQAAFDSGIYWGIQATQAFGFAMKKRGSGSIINICSMYAVVVPSPDLYEGTDTFNPPGYSMAKAGLLQFTRYAASFLSPEVRVNALSPGAIPNTNTDSGRPNAIKGASPVLDRLQKKILLRRMGHPNDLVGGLGYLASDASGYVTGQNIIIDGGLTVT
jgi:gluconate 5-dehydrogenase